MSKIETSKVFTLLSQNRLKAYTYSQLVELTGMNERTVTRHLKALVESDLVETSKFGSYAYKFHPVHIQAEVLRRGLLRFDAMCKKFESDEEIPCTSIKNEVASTMQAQADVSPAEIGKAFVKKELNKIRNERLKSNDVKFNMGYYDSLVEIIENKLDTSKD